MRSLYASLLALLFCFSATSEVMAQAALDLPIRINCGGRQITDSNGNVWLADEGVNVDPLDIRPNDIGGGQAIVNWSAGVVPASVTALGFDGNNGEDLQIFKDIRWDNAGEVPDWHMEFTVPNSLYTVNFYLVDAGDGRHYQFALEGAVVAEDVHQLAFPVGDGQVPGVNIAGKYSFDVEVTDGVLNIGILPGFGLPGAGDPNPILQGLEILINDPNFDPCDDPEFGICAAGFRGAMTAPDDDWWAAAGDNVALGGTATQSTEGWGGAAPRAIDGNTDGVWGSNSTTHTNGANSWWEVDLGDVYDIGAVRMWNRMDCCRERLAAITVEVLGADRSVAFSQGGLDALSAQTLACFTGGVEGQFVRISTPGAYLSLAEVQVYEPTFETTGGFSWNAPACVDSAGYNVYRNDELLLELAGDATGFEHMPDARTAVYRLDTVQADGSVCESSTVTLNNESYPFDVPVRINFAGEDAVDGDGNVWMGDGNSPADRLGIRPNDGNGGNHILNWCDADNAALVALGFDPANAEMKSALSSIRWDSDSLNSPFELEIPMADGAYSVGMYFLECCCANRAYTVEIEGEAVSGVINQAAFQWSNVGYFNFDAVVADGALSITLRGVAGGDVNALITALEVTERVPEICDNGEDDDGDGDADCADSECPDCVEICDNGEDDDFDGDVDADDLDCGPLEIAESLLVSLDAKDETAGSDLWRNRGTMGDFVKVGSPRVETRDFGVGVSFNEGGRSGETYESDVPAPAGIVGANPTRSIEMWVWPSSNSPNEETLVAWGKRGGPDGSNMSFLYGTNPSHGAVGHWGGPDLGWNNGGGIPSRGEWHHLVYTYDGETTRVYTDNCLVFADCDVSNEEFLGVGRINTHGGTKIRIAQQTEGDGVNMTIGLQGHILVSKMRIHDGALTPEQISSNYELELPEFQAGPPEICDDGIDNDRDGDADCDDSDCDEASACGAQFVRGDANGDGGIDISDPTHTLRNLFAGGPGAPCSDSADANDDGGLTLTDAIYSLNYLFRGDAAPVAPFPACGVDDTADDLGCQTATAGCE